MERLPYGIALTEMLTAVAFEERDSNSRAANEVRFFCQPDLRLRARKPIRLLALDLPVVVNSRAAARLIDPAIRAVGFRWVR
ncbi:hypothetical protein A1D31_38590 [Bradyrhizobium liaoningense]|nr:hypothetical protein A1D31_38590 [Bradyrhizobium liaoningense]